VRIPSLIALILITLTTACTQKAPVLPKGTVIALSDVFTGQYRLIDHHGTTTTQSTFRGKPVLIYFGFTSCPDVCPAALGVLSATLNEMGNNASNIQPLFISLDPERDTVDTIKTYLSFDTRILGLTGSVKDVEAAKTGFKVYSQKQPLPTSALEYTVNHSSFFYFVDASGTPQFALKDTLSPQELASFILYHAGQ